MGTDILATRPLHLSFDGSTDLHTHLLIYGLMIGPFCLLVLVTYVQHRRELREDAAAVRGDPGDLDGDDPETGRPGEEYPDR